MSKSIYRSCQYRKTAGLFGKDPNYDLITPNEIIRHFIISINAEEVTKLARAGGEYLCTRGMRIGSGRFHNEELRSLYRSPKINRVIKSRRLRGQVM